MTRRAIVLDANILIRAVLGRRVRDLITEHATDVSFFAPDAAFDEARQYLPGLLEKRGVGGAAALATLDALEAVVRPIDAELYEPQEQAALARIGERDAGDWPTLASRCCWAARCGPKTPTSSARAWRPGRQVV